MFLPDKNLMPTTETKPAPFTLPSLIAWLEAQAPEKEYDAGDYNVCVLAQYTRHHGGSNNNQHYTIGDAQFPVAPRIGFDDPVYLASVNADSTFGAALTRAREYAAKAPS